MRSFEEIMENRRVIVNKRSKDGFDGIIEIHGWRGTVVVSWGAGWDHVSVAPVRNSYTPSWSDMCALKDVFFRDDEAVIQIHPERADYINEKKNCLHLWRANDREMVLPPAFMVGRREGQTIDEVMKEAQEYYKEHGYEW